MISNVLDEDCEEGGKVAKFFISVSISESLFWNAFNILQWKKFKLL